jgi:purine-binding chemotaxis protein CheW
MPVEAVREIIPAQPATRIPGAPAAVDGLVNVRGTLLTVVDAHTLLGRTAEPGVEGSILVVELGGKYVGFEVGEVLDLLEISPDELESSAELPGIDPRLAKAVARQAGRVLAVLDTDALLAPLIGG